MPQFVRPVGPPKVIRQGRAPRKATPEPVEAYVVVFEPPEDVQVLTRGLDALRSYVLWARRRSDS